MLVPFALASLVASQVALACGDHEHVHSRRMQSAATPSTDWPTVPLEWGDVNFLHTTDTHGWLLGHLHTSEPEPSFSGDFGDFASFVEHMKAEADRKGVDLLLVDSGDLHDGNGLADGYPVGGVDGQKSNEFLLRAPYDVMAIGNHELYQYPVAYDMHANFASRLNGRYLSSNVNITVLDKENKPVSVPLGARFAKFKTKHNRKVTAFGVLFEFTGNHANTTVQKVGAMVNETWFKEAITEEPDFFLLVGHMPVQNDKWPTVFNAIRAVHRTTPILVFGGHTHVRDCVQYDPRSMALESGQYMETIGWMSAKLGAKNSTAPLAFSRRYLDANRNTYTFHTRSKGFDTPKGKAITKDMGKLAKEWNLTEVWGQTPQDYYLDRVSYPDKYSLLSLVAEQVFPAALNASNPSRATLPHTVVIDTGSQRFDLYSGPFTRNDQFIVSPYTNVVVYLPVPAKFAKQIVGQLNGGTTAKRMDTEDPEEYAQGDIRYRFGTWKQEQYAAHYLQRRDQGLTLGYTTTDSCPGVGDDVQHEPIPYLKPPKYISLPFPDVSDDTIVDVIFFDFYQNKVLSIVNSLGAGSGKNYTTAEVKGYGVDKPLLTNAIYEPFVKAAWSH